MWCELQSDRSPKKSDCEWIAHQNEPLWANRSQNMSELGNHSFVLSELLFYSFSCKKKWFAEKNDKRNPNPGNHKKTCLSLKPKMDPPYCTKLYATVLIFCTTNPHVHMYLKYWYPVIEKLFPLLYKQWFTNSIVCYGSLAM